MFKERALILSGTFKKKILIVRDNTKAFPKIAPLKIRGARGVMKERVLILRGDSAGDSLNSNMELVEKPNYYHCI